ncbi:unnamed protein product, partial [Rotaria sp. Silwood2]
TGLSKELSYPSWNLFEFVTKIMKNLFGLRSLNFGMETSFFLHRWPFKTIQTLLIYLSVTLSTTCDLLNIMSIQPLTCTLQELHIKLSH